jgi:hypothetical protein
MTHRMHCKRTGFIPYNNTPLSNHHQSLYDRPITSVCLVDRTQDRATGAEENPDHNTSLYLTTNTNLEQWMQRSAAAFITVEQSRTVWQSHIDSNGGINI